VISAHALFTHPSTGLSIDIVADDPDNAAAANCPIVNPGAARWVQCTRVVTAPVATTTYVVIGSDTWQGGVYVDDIAIVPYRPPSCTTPLGITIAAWPDYTTVTLAAGATFYPLGGAAIFYAPAAPPPGPESGLAAQVHPNGLTTTGESTFVFFGNVSSATLIVCGADPTPSPTPDTGQCPSFTDYPIPAWPSYVDIPYTVSSVAYPLAGELYYAAPTAAPPAPGTAGAQPIAGAFGFSSAGVGRVYAHGAAGALRLCTTAPTPTGTATGTATRTPSATRTATATPRATATSTPTATATPRPTVTVGGQTCREYAIADGATVQIADSWTTTTVGPSPAQHFTVTAPAGVVRFGDIQVPPPTALPMDFAGDYQSPGVWIFASLFSASNNGVESILRVCLPTAQLPTATATTTATATSTLTPPPSSTATSAALPPPPTVRAGPTLTPLPAPTSSADAPFPDLGIVLPTLEPLVCPTVVLVISDTAVIGVVQTMQAGISTPVAAVQTASAPYSWAGGATLAVSWTVQLSPALRWLAVINPANTGWGIVGGPLWALAPLLLPILPIFGVGLLIVVVRFVLWLLAWFLRFVDQIEQLIELIPGE
jgi:hypothetical protein